MVIWERARLRQTVCAAALLALLGSAGLLLSQEGAGIPCVFHLITGLDCPGCGVTRMLRALAVGDITAAWRYNPFVMAVSPLLLLLLLRLTARYVATGNRMLTRGENAFVWALIAGLILFGILRNMPFYPY